MEINACTQEFVTTRLTVARAWSVASQIAASSQITPTMRPHAATILSSQVTILTYFLLQNIAHVTHVCLSLLFSFDQHVIYLRLSTEPFWQVLALTMCWIEGPSEGELLRTLSSNKPQTQMSKWRSHYWWHIAWVSNYSDSMRDDTKW